MNELTAVIYSLAKAQARLIRIALNEETECDLNNLEIQVIEDSLIDFAEKLKNGPLRVK